MVAAVAVSVAGAVAVAVYLITMEVVKPVRHCREDGCRIYQLLDL